MVIQFVAVFNYWHTRQSYKETTKKLYFLIHTSDYDQYVKCAAKEGSQCFRTLSRFSGNMFFPRRSVPI